MSTHHMSKKSKLNDDTPQVMINGYKGHEDVPENLTHVRFHPSVLNVDFGAFKDRKQLREVILNDGLRDIGKHAFFECTSLQSINIPSTVTKIGEYAIHGCSSLTEIVLNEGLRVIGGDAFSFCTPLQSITIPSTITEIGAQAFFVCKSLREVVLHNGVVRIGRNAFRDCNSLRSVEFSSTVTEIGKGAFCGCTSLREVVLNEGVQNIKAFTFKECRSLQSITIPSPVIDIEQCAFRGSSLREIIILNDEVQIADEAFLGCTLLERFKFPSLFTCLDNIIQAGQRDIEAKMDDIPAVEWRGGELVIPSVRQEIEKQWGMETVAEIDKEKLDKIIGLISYYEVKEATTMFELALWKARIDQADISSSTNRAACPIEVPGPVKDTILQYLQ